MVHIALRGMHARSGHRGVGPGRMSLRSRRHSITREKNTLARENLQHLVERYWLLAVPTKTHQDLELSVQQSLRLVIRFYLAAKAALLRFVG